MKKGEGVYVYVLFFLERNSMTFKIPKGSELRKNMNTIKYLVYIYKKTSQYRLYEIYKVALLKLCQWVRQNYTPNLFS